MKNLFNTALFLTETNPLPQQIFAKAFDAYFFLHYPHNQYQQEGILNPFHFLNNISENKVTISNPMNDNRLEFQNKNWAFEAYFKQFDAICRPERFLFWAGETDKWAMVSDAKTGISVYGIDCCGGRRGPRSRRSCWANSATESRSPSIASLTKRGWSPICLTSTS